MLPRKSDIVPADRLDFVMFFYCYERPCLHRVAVYALEDRLPTCSSAVSNAFLPFTVFTTDMVVVYPADALICVLEGKKARGRCEGVSRFFLKCPRDLRWWGGDVFEYFETAEPLHVRSGCLCWSLLHALPRLPIELGKP